MDPEYPDPRFRAFRVGPTQAAGGRNETEIPIGGTGGDRDVAPLIAAVLADGTLRADEAACHPQKIATTVWAHGCGYAREFTGLEFWPEVCPGCGQPGLWTTTLTLGAPAESPAERPTAPAEYSRTSGGPGDDLRAAAIAAGARALWRFAQRGQWQPTPFEEIPKLWQAERSAEAQAAYDAMAPHIRRQVAEEAAQIAERVEFSISEIFDRSPADYLAEAALRIRRIGAKP